MGKSPSSHGCAPRSGCHPLYKIWRGMKKRCNNPNYVGYKYYGARGIRVCDMWESSFKDFYDWSISNGYVSGLQIDRIDNDGGYCPDNCRFVTPAENAQNRRSSISRRVASFDSPTTITINGVTQHYAEWARCSGLRAATVLTRFRRGARGGALLLPTSRGTKIT